MNGRVMGKKNDSCSTEHSTNKFKLSQSVSFMNGDELTDPGLPVA